MMDGGLLGSRVLLHILISMNYDVGLKDHYKAKTNVSKKPYQANPIIGNKPPNNHKIQRS
jgi:hypothetical protein